MKKIINEICSGIYIIENYISEDSCKFLIDSFSNNLIETPRKNIFGGISGLNVSSPDTADEYKDDYLYNVAIDLHNGILFSINNLISNVFKKEHQIKSYFFSCMVKDAFNDIHMDNHYLDDDGILKIKPKYQFDKSGLLYLNDNYEGGELCFPEQNLSLKPKPGSLIFFEGDYSKPHGVNKIISGSRYNLITFYEPVN
jgi:hypothetical protein